ncbi:MAG: TolC family protein [Verrucomicrobiota bacterium]
MKNYAFILIPALFLGACASSPPRGIPEIGMEVPDAFVVEATSGVVRDGWLMTFNDTQLYALVIEALKNNPDLEAAVARVDQAVALARREGAAAQPTLNFNANGSKSQNLSRTSGPVDSFDSFRRSRSTSLGASLDVSWELDVWGRVRAAQSAALADVDAAEDNLQGARFSLAAQTAKAWFSASESYLQYELALETEKSFRETAELTEGRFKRGLVTAADVHLTRTSAAAAAARVGSTRQSLNASVRAIEVLLGRYPANELEIMDDLIAVPSAIPAGIPSDLLLRRPDLRAAERSLAASLQRTRSARADFFPRIALTGSAGTTSDALRDIIDPKHLVWNFLVNLTAPVLDGGLRSSNLQLQKGQVAEAAANFRSSALNAFQEVENFLDAEILLKTQETALEEAAVESEAAYRRTQQEYAKGLTDINLVLSAQRSFIDSQRDFLTIKRVRLNNRVDLYLSLGGNVLPPNDQAYIESPDSPKS